jgi:hypothetical protein
MKSASLARQDSESPGDEAVANSPDASVVNFRKRPLARSWRLLLLFVLVSAGYVLWRGHDYIVWDDTSSASFNRYSNGLHYSWSNANLASSLIRESFSRLQGDGYRPLSAFIRGCGAAWFSRDAIEPLPFVVANGLVLGLWSVVLWILARRFTDSDLGADLVVFLNVASIPVLTASLVISSGIQAIVPLLICGGLLLYGKAKTSRRPWIWQIPLCAVLLVGPWFREFAGVTPLLILAAEILFLLGRPSWTVIVVAVVGFLHALFPTALVHFIAFPDLPVLPVNRLGNLAHALELTRGRGLLAKFAVLHWRIFADIVSVLPPTLFVIAASSLVLTLLRRQSLRPTRGVLFLSAFFALTFLPFLRAFHEQVHFGYCTIPISILLTLAIERLWFESKTRPAMRIALIGVLLLPLGDHALDLYSVRHVTDAIYAAIERQAAWFKDHTPPGTVVMGNAHHIEDIRYYSAGHIDVLAIAGGTPDPKRWVPDRKALAAAIQGMTHPLYCLDARLTADAGQRGANRRNWVVRDEALDLEAVRAVSFRCRYPFLDPLRMALPTQNLCWPGPPDFEFDFYRGRARKNHRWFQFEVSLDYRLYAVKSPVVRKYSSQAVLLAEDVQGFNIVGYKNEVVAIPRSEGAFEPQRVERCGYSQIYRGESLEEVTQRVRTAQRAVKR